MKVTETGGAAGALLAEREAEAATTRCVLEGVPESLYGWRPHEKGRSMGELCAHVAAIMSGIPRALDVEAFDVSDGPPPDEAPASTEALLALFDEGVGEARAWLAGLDAEELDDRWRLVRDGQEIMTMPRSSAIRSLLLNHHYHHRGQLSAYLRAAGAEVPPVYGPSADENPFG